MKLHVAHAISYRYTEPVTLAPHLILMRPRENHHVSVLRYALTVEPAANLFWARDHNENSLAWAYLYDRTDHLAVRTDFEVETLDHNPYNFVVRMDAVRYPFPYLPAEAPMLAPYLAGAGGDGTLLVWLRSILPQFPDETLELLTVLNRTLREHIAYRTRPEPNLQSPDETIRLRSGTCRDFAELMLHACRALGFAARFVSGYLFDPSEEDPAVRGSLHAWTEVYLPGAGWKGFDATHGILADAHFIPVAVGRSSENLNPVTGAFWGRSGVTSAMDATVEVTEIQPIGPTLERDP